MSKRQIDSTQPLVIAETETRIALKCDGRTIAYVAIGPQDSEWAVNLVTAVNCHQELLDALRKIAAGEGYYGLQAREYKDIAKAAIASAVITRNSISKGLAT
jgi:hypothetical protein